MEPDKDQPKAPVATISIASLQKCMNNNINKHAQSHKQHQTNIKQSAITVTCVRQKHQLHAFCKIQIHKMCKHTLMSYIVNSKCVVNIPSHVNNLYTM